MGGANGAATEGAAKGHDRVVRVPSREAAYGGGGGGGLFSPVPYRGAVDGTPKEGREEGDGWLDQTTLTPERGTSPINSATSRPHSHSAPQRAYVGVYSSTNNPPLSTQPKITRLTQCERPFDGRGVFSYIGTLGGTQPFKVRHDVPRSLRVVVDYFRNMRPLVPCADPSLLLEHPCRCRRTRTCLAR
jgi:hypothetical protein